jgi:ABC-type Fe3+/spermidine/putrescine transport system ATPase subunit
MSAGRFEFQTVSKRHGQVAALDGVSFALEPGQHTALLGPSGCGKSTLLRLFSGLEAPSTGQVLLDGKVISTARRIVLPPHRRGLTMVFQDLALWPNLTALGNVLLGLAGTRLSRAETRQRAEEALAACRIGGLADRKPAQLSGGEQQRVALARAIAPRPRFLLLDEPFAGLDLMTKTHLFEEISGLADKRNLTVVLVTHDPQEALTLCQFATVLDAGRLVEAGPFESLLRAPRSELLRRFQTHCQLPVPPDQL